MSNTPSTDQYAVFGNPIHHSKSPTLHAAFGQQTGEAIEYGAQCVELDHFRQAADAFFSAGGKGLNITVPFKLDAFNYAHQLTARAEAAGAVNTLIARDGQIIGDNTDGVGLVYDITQNLSWPIKDKRILVLGAGGAVRGVLGPLCEAEPESITIANRTLAKAQALAKQSLQDNVSACSYEDLVHQGLPFDMVINGTSASLGGELPPLPDTLVTQNSYCYDMMYTKGNTVFIQWCKDRGVVHSADGLGMLVSQGAESFFQWRGVRPEVKSVIEQLRSSM